MANHEHLVILKKGAEVWNQWRKEHPDIHPDLTKANLSGVKLFGVDLSNANLSDANLREADLRKAELILTLLENADLSNAKLCNTIIGGGYMEIEDEYDFVIPYSPKINLHKADLSYAYIRYVELSGSDLSGADLTEANLSGVKLFGVDLRGANLSEAKITGANNPFRLSNHTYELADLRYARLDGANLSNTNFNGSDLSNTDFTNASFFNTIFGDRDLRLVKGLEHARHLGPSSLSINTIYLSQGNIPEAFLKGTGAPDSFIEYIRSLVSSPIKYYTCFISYSSKDKAFAERLYADLQSNNVRCWFAPKDMKIGDEIRTRIDESIRMYDKLLLVLSEHSVESAWVKKEVETAYEKESKQNRFALFPVRLDDAVMQTSQAWAADIRRMRHISDFTCWKDNDAYQKAFNRLLHDLKAEAQ